jgi:hypothetical protein
MYLSTYFIYLNESRVAVMDVVFGVSNSKRYIIKVNSVEG